MRLESEFNFKTFADTVFGPERGERVVIVIDRPTTLHPTNPDWEARDPIHALPVYASEGL